MVTKECPTKKGAVKNRKNMKTDNQDSEELIDQAELERRGGIIGNKTYHIIAYLRSYYEGNIKYEHVKNLTELAEYIYQRKEMYVSTHHRYRLMKFRSISDYVHGLSRQVMQDIEREKKYKENYNSKY